MVTKLPFSEETVGGYLSSNCYSHEEGGNYAKGEINRSGNLPRQTQKRGRIYGGNTVAPDMITGVDLNGIRKISYTYDGLNRLSTRNLNNYLTEYTYLQGANANSTTTLVSSMKNGNDTLAYTYDELGNITSISKNGTLIESYTYDALNQLKTVTKGTDVYTYNYDNGGNILSVTKNGTTTKTYTYGDSEWKDLLTAYNGNAITYDNIGNPLTYYNGSTFTWSDGRKLTGITKGTDNISYTYDANGLRTSKTVNGVTTEYYWLNGRLYAEKTPEYTLTYLYDENGSPITLRYKAGNTQDTYHYIYNAQGDVIRVRDSSYHSIGVLNPFRYRGYYYDTETGFYYCQSRYYDPEISRWINADGQMAGVGGDIGGYNLFTYCFNNPINLEDSTGHWPKFLKRIAKAVVGVALVAVAGAAIAATLPVLSAAIAVGHVAAGVVAVGTIACAGVTAVLGSSIAAESVTEVNPVKEAIGEGAFNVALTLSTAGMCTGMSSLPTGSSTTTSQSSNATYNLNGTKDSNYVNNRGWTNDMINNAISNGKQGTSINMANNAPCIVYSYPGIDNQYVVIEKSSRSIVQVSNFYDSGWIPDSRITWES